jgi:UDP-3-O-[3-hydroxymyristoyl] glucosamine N-acyltransferase
MTHRLRDLAERVAGEVVGDPGVEIRGVATLESAQPGEMVFAESPEWLEKAMSSGASAVLAPRGMSGPKPLLLVGDVRAALSTLLRLFEVEFLPEPGVSPLAHVAPSAEIGAGVDIGPFACVMDRAVLEPAVKVHAFVYVGADCRVGTDTIIYPHATLFPSTRVGARCRLHAGCVIGDAGFGYRLEEGRHHPVPQIGTVILGDDVEVGTNAAVDRAMIGATVIGEGTKVDNLVQIAHNVRIGSHCIIAGQSGISGSCQLGDYVVLGGQTGIVEHIKIGSHVRTGGQTGVSRDLPSDQDYWGTPARPMKKTLALLAAAGRADKLVQEVRELKAKLRELEQRLGR